MVKEVAFCVYPVSDVRRALSFYETALGLKVSSNYKDQWIEFDIKGATFAVTGMDIGATPGAAGAQIAFEVDDIEQTLEQCRTAGAARDSEIYETPVCRMAGAADPDGNRFIIHKRKN